MRPVLGIPLPELTAQLQKAIPTLEPYRSKQIFNAIYQQGITRIEDIKTLPNSLITELKQNYSIGYPTQKESLKSVDGTRKWLLEYENKSFESVYIPEVNKKQTTGSLCISSQVGCSLQCAFCHTGTQKFMGNLTTAQIVGQYMNALKDTNYFPYHPTKKRQVSNMVFMGQGEPLYNFKNVGAAVRFLNETFNLSPWKTTVSTSGLVPLMPKIGELSACLAVSLHAVSNELRDKLVPLNKQYPISELVKGCLLYLNEVKQHTYRRITFEYVMLDQVNDSDIEARELARILKPLSPHVNLIPFNPWPGTVFECSPQQRIKSFQAILQEADIPCHIRTSRGRDIMAACGQLKSSSLSKGQRETQISP
ncbi:hypothetical protein HDV06_003938 [Boothiomyces sp. JEL0866]|nr:hypothetical protein HDV06_003938 [Boothiomyces sp. JEL0866]